MALRQRSGFVRQSRCCRSAPAAVAFIAVAGIIHACTQYDLLSYRSSCQWHRTVRWRHCAGGEGGCRGGDVQTEAEDPKGDMPVIALHECTNVIWYMGLVAAAARCLTWGRRLWRRLR